MCFCLRGLDCKFDFFYNKLMPYCVLLFFDVHCFLLYVASVGGAISFFKKEMSIKSTGFLLFIPYTTQVSYYIFCVLV